MPVLDEEKQRAEWLELGQLRDGTTGLPEQPWPRPASPGTSPNESR